MAQQSGHPYRVIYYPARNRCLTKTVSLAWHWSWRYGRDPVFECWKARELNVSLIDRANAIAAEINAEIESGRQEANRRFRLVAEADAISSADRMAIWKDLLTVQLTIASLSAMAVKTELDRYGPAGAA